MDTHSKHLPDGDIFYFIIQQVYTVNLVFRGPGAPSFMHSHSIKYRKHCGTLYSILKVICILKKNKTRKVYRECWQPVTLTRAKKFSLQVERIKKSQSSLQKEYSRKNNKYKYPIIAICWRAARWPMWMGKSI